MKFVNLSLATTLLAASIGFNSSAVADLGTATYPASMCVKWRASDVQPTLNSSRIFNINTTREMYVDCPIPHDIGTTNDHIEDVDIGYIDNSRHRNLRCWALSVNQAGTSLFIVGNGGTRISRAGTDDSRERYFDFGQLNGHNFSHAYIGCVVPRRDLGDRSSGLTVYTVSQ